MKKLLFLLLTVALFGWTGCTKDEIHPLTETTTGTDGIVYTVYHLEVAVNLDSVLVQNDPVEIRLMNMSDRSISDIRIERDAKRNNCLTFYIPQGFNYKEGLYRTYQARRNGFLFSFPIELECDNEQLVSCEIMTKAMASSYTAMTVADKTQPGGTQQNPFLIASYKDLKTFRGGVETDLSRGEDLYFKQTADIEVNDANLPAGEQGMKPIGFVEAKSEGFAGHYDGNNKYIKGLHIRDIKIDNLGLFSELLPGASVQNLTIRSFHITDTASSNIGALCGKVHEAVVLTNVRTEDCILIGKDKVGGIVGLTKSSLTDCSAYSATIKANNYAGAITGSIESVTTVHITNCSNEGACSIKISNNYAGGIAGAATGTVVLKECTNFATPIEGTTGVGGIIGMATAKLTMTDCSNDLDVQSNQTNLISLTGQNAVGGLIGQLEITGESTITNCFSSASIKASYLGLGGLIGYVKGTAVLNIIDSRCGVEGLIELKKAIPDTPLGDMVYTTALYVGGVIGYTAVETNIESTNTPKNYDDKANSANNAGIVADANYVGGVVGYSDSWLRLKNIQATADVNATGFSVGGLVGRGVNLLINDSYVKRQRIKGADEVGGLVGTIENGSLIVRSSESSRSLFNGFVNEEGNTSSSNCGGILGLVKNGSVELSNVYVTGKVTGDSKIGGLIGSIEKGERLRLTDCRVEGYLGIKAVSYAGGMVGKIQSKEVAIKNCQNNAPIITTKQIVGGIVGYFESSGCSEIPFRDCTNNGKVEGDTKVGGILGYLYDLQPSDDNAMDNCTNNGEIMGKTNVGGCIGVTSDKRAFILNQLSNTGAVTSNSKSSEDDEINSIGGVLGRAHVDLTIKYCNNQGKVTAVGSYNVGGIVGRMGDSHGDNQRLKIVYSYNTGEINVSGNSKVRAGGIVGKMESVKGDDYGIFNCYNTQVVSGSSGKRGGIAGVTDWNVEIKRCYYAGTNMGDRAMVDDGGGKAQEYDYNYILDLSAGKDDRATRLTEDKFKLKESFKSWNFDADGHWTYGGTPAGARPVLRLNME